MTKKGHLVVVRVVVEVLSVDCGLDGEVPSAQLVPHSNTIGKLCNQEMVEMAEGVSILEPFAVKREGLYICISRQDRLQMMKR